MRAKPFVKWAGGKGRLLPILMKHLPDDAASRRHVEPFLGGGALFFHRKPEEALLSEVNPSLVTAYREIKNNLSGVLGHLASLASRMEKEDYYTIRSAYNRSGQDPVLQTARFIYLNRWCFNGLHRVNKKGEFNVPVGSYKNPTVLDANNLRAVSKALQGVAILSSDFEGILDHVTDSDFVYMDPPYIPEEGKDIFTSYTADGFSMDDHERLVAVCHELDREGCKWMLSNSDVPVVREMYDKWHIHSTQGPRTIGSKTKSRTPSPEVIVTNYPVAG